VHLTRRLAEYEGSSLAGQAMAAAATVPIKPVIHAIAPITIDDAQKQLRDALKKCCDVGMKRLRKKKTRHDCEVCGMKT
ncbi:hypothetical protein PMAYCL1PPCAC_14528, partial [Pristionchus mayeri]